MPEIIVYLAEGRSIEQKRGFVRAVTKAATDHFGTDPERVVIQIVECPPHNKAKGGVLFSDRGTPAGRSG